MIGAIALADFRERVRRPSFFMLVIAALALGYFFVPDAHAGYSTVSLGEATHSLRGIEDSAWMGAATALLCVTFFTLLGFFVIRGSLQRDVALGTSSLVAASLTGRSAFAFGKALSDLGVLAIVGAIITAAAVVMQAIRRESSSFDLFAYAAPYIVIVLPAFAIVVAFSVASACIRPLRGWLGGVAWFFVWTGLCLINALPASHLGGGPFGTGVILQSMQHDASIALGHPSTDLSIGITVGHQLSSFRYHGLHLGITDLASRTVWLLVAAAMLALASRAFDRFAGDANIVQRPARRIALSRFVPFVPAFVRAELSLVLDGGVVWTSALALIAFLPIFLPTQAGAIVASFALVVPIERFARLGLAARANSVEPLLDAAPASRASIVIARWFAGIGLGSVLFSGWILRALAHGDGAGAAALICVVIVIPAIALACGALTGDPRLYEALALLVWYIGPLNHIAGFDAISEPLTAPGPVIAVAVALCAFSLAATFGAEQRRRLRA